MQTMMDPAAPPPPDKGEPAGPEEPQVEEPQVEEPQVEETGMTVDELLLQITPRAWVTPTLSVLILVGFVMELALGVSATSPTGAQLLKAGGEFGPSFVDGEWWRALTSMFLHSGPLHLAFNLWAFWSIGHLTERVFGNRSFLAIYVLSGIAASLTSVAWSPMTVSVGASGAIFGVYGALLAFVVLHRGVFPPEYLAQQRNSIVGFIGYNVVFGLSQKNTDMAAHAGGLVAGALVGSVLARDVLRPAENAGRRLLITAGLVVLLALAAFGVRARALKVPEIRADRAADAGLVALQAKQFQKAIDHYTEALAIRPEFGFRFNRGLAYYGLDDLKMAQQDMRDAHALKSGPKTHSMLCEIGVSLGGTPELIEEAASHCTEAAAGADSPAKKAALLSMRAIARGMQTRVPESLADAEAALALDPHAVMARAHRVGARLEDGKFAEAEEDCEKLLAEPAPRAFDFEICSRVAHKRKDNVAERTRLDHLLAIDPKNRRGLHARAWLNQIDNRLADSVADYTALLAIDPEIASAWNNRAWVEVELGSFAAARADADRAVALGPSSAMHLGTRCFALAGLGDLTAARIDCVRALELEPTLFDRGMLAFIDKRYAAARADWESAGSEDPMQAREIRQWLAKLPPP